MLLPLNRRNAKPPKQATPVYLHLVTSERRLALGPLADLGVDAGGMVLQMELPNGGMRTVTCPMDGRGAILYGDRRYEMWIVNSKQAISPDEVLEEPRRYHGVRHSG